MSPVEFLSITVQENLGVLDAWNLCSLGEQALLINRIFISRTVTLSTVVPSPGKIIEKLITFDLKLARECSPEQPSIDSSGCLFSFSLSTVVCSVSCRFVPLCVASLSSIIGILVVNISVFVLTHNGLLRGYRRTHGGSCCVYECGIRKEPSPSLASSSSIPSSETVSSCVVVVSQTFGNTKCQSSHARHALRSACAFLLVTYILHQQSRHCSLSLLTVIPVQPVHRPACSVSRQLQ